MHTPFIHNNRQNPAAAQEFPEQPEPFNLNEAGALFATFNIPPTQADSPLPPAQPLPPQGRERRVRKSAVSAQIIEAEQPSKRQRSERSSANELREPEAEGHSRDSEFQSAASVFRHTMTNIAVIFGRIPQTIPYFQQWSLLDQGLLAANPDLGPSLLDCKNEEEVNALNLFRARKISSMVPRAQAVMSPEVARFQMAVLEFKNTMSKIVEFSDRIPQAVPYFQQWDLLDQGLLAANEDLGPSLLNCKNEEEVNALNLFRAQKIMSMMPRAQAEIPAERRPEDPKLKAAVYAFRTNMSALSAHFDRFPQTASYFQQWGLLDQGQLAANEDLGPSLLNCKNEEEVNALNLFRAQKISNTLPHAQRAFQIIQQNEVESFINQFLN